MPRCEYCGKLFKTVQGLRRHELTQHPQAREELKLVTRKDMKGYFEYAFQERAKTIVYDLDVIKHRLDKIERELEEELKKIWEVLGKLNERVSVLLMGHALKNR